MKLHKKVLERKTSKLAWGAILAATLFGFGNSAYAVPAPPPVYTLADCPTSFTEDGTGKVLGGAGTQTAASDCQYLTPPDNSSVASLAYINGAAFFTFSDWEFNAGNSQVSVPDGTGMGGAWAITAANFALYDYMMVFKDGKGTNLIGFLLNEEFASGTWASPFSYDPFSGLQPGQTKDVSHYSIVQRENEVVGCTPGDPFCNPAEIPEPSGIALMSLSMIGLGLALRRRRSPRA